MTNQGTPSSRDELMSESRSEDTFYRNNEPPSKLDEVLDWIDGIPLTKKIVGRSIARDFSDAVLMSEVLKFYYPGIVASHNYITSNSMQGKRDNWNVLNRKVLTKIGMRLSPETIDQLVHSQGGVIERILLDLRNQKLVSHDTKVDQSTTDLINNNAAMELTLKKISVKKRSIFKWSIDCVAGFFVGLFRAILAVVCFWRWFAEKSAEKTQGRLKDGEEREIRNIYLKPIGIAEHNSEAIKTLRHKVAFLEGTIKLKDAKIACLENELYRCGNGAHGHYHAAEAVNSSRMSIECAGKAWRRPRTQI